MAIRKKAETAIAYELAERAAEIIKERVEYGEYGEYDSDELINEAVNDALDDGLIYYSDMWKVIEDYGDVQEIWDFVMQSGDVFVNLCDDIYLSLGQFFTPDGYSNWEEYINKNTEDDDRYARRYAMMRRRKRGNRR